MSSHCCFYTFCASQSYSHCGMCSDLPEGLPGNLNRDNYMPGPSELGHSDMNVAAVLTRKQVLTSRRSWIHSFI